MCVDSDACVAKQVGKPLRHQDPDLFDGAAQLQDAHVQTGLGPLCAVPVERNLLLDKREEGQYFIIHLSGWVSELCSEHGVHYVLRLAPITFSQIHCRVSPLKSDVSGESAAVTRTSLGRLYKCSECVCTTEWIAVFSALFKLQRRGVQGSLTPNTTKDATLPELKPACLNWLQHWGFVSKVTLFSVL